MTYYRTINGKSFTLSDNNKIFDAYISNTLRQAIYGIEGLFILVDINQYTIITETQARKIMENNNFNTKQEIVIPQNKENKNLLN